MEPSTVSRDFERLEIGPLQNQNLWRSIPTCHPTKYLYYPDKLEEAEQALAAALADATSEIDIAMPKKDRWYDYGDNERLEFCFDALNIPPSRFTGGVYPVWYGCDDQEVSKAEVAYHLMIQAKKELAFTEHEKEIIFERALCKAQVKSDLAIDLKSIALSSPATLMEGGPPYPFCNLLGSIAKERGIEIILTNSRRLHGGENWAVLSKPAILSSVVKAFWDAKISKEESLSICGSNATFSNGWMHYI